MSVSLVRKGLQLVDECFDKGVNKNKKLGLSRENCKIKRKTNNGRKINILSVEKKLTVTEAKKLNKSKEEILQKNLEKLELIKKASKIDLDQALVDKIIERAVERRPIKKQKPLKKDQKTAFTEEDFKKFEEEYFNE